MTSGALSFIIYTYRNNLGRMVTNILGYQRHNTFLTVSMNLVTYSYIYNPIYV